jgi:hypothetical protein
MEMSLSLAIPEVIGGFICRKLLFLSGGGAGALKLFLENKLEMFMSRLTLYLLPYFFYSSFQDQVPNRILEVFCPLHPFLCLSLF